LYASGLRWVFVGALHRVLALQVLGWVLQAFFLCCRRACMKALQVSPDAWCIYDWLFVHSCGVVVFCLKEGNRHAAVHAEHEPCDAQIVISCWGAMLLLHIYLMRCSLRW
jgi:hypothetical protein